MTDDRHTPYDIEVEQSCIGSLLVSNDLIDIAAADLRAEHFYDPLHQRLYRTILTIRSEGTVTPLTLHSALKSDPGLASVGGHGYLAGLAQAAPALPNIQQLASILIDLANRRELIRIGEGITNQAYDPPRETPSQAIADGAMEAILRVGQATRPPPPSLSEAGMASLGDVEAMHSGRNIPRVRTGILKLDDETGGFEPGDFVVVMGASGQGKSTLLGSLALGAAMKHQPVIFFSLEMSQKQLVNRMICDLDYDEHPWDAIWYSRFRNGKLNDDQFSRAGVAIQRLPDSLLRIDDQDDLGVQQITSRARGYASRFPGQIGVVVVDYIQIVATQERQDGTREQEVASVARGLKSLSKRLGWPVVAGSQINEGPNQRTDKNRRPRLSDVSESKRIIKEADFVLCPYREAYYLQQEWGAGGPDQSQKAEYEACKHWIELLCLKNRHGRAFRDLRLWTEIGASAIRDEEPIRTMEDPPRGLFDD